MATPCSKRKMPLSMEKKTTPQTKTKEKGRTHEDRNTRFCCTNNLPPSREREKNAQGRASISPADPATAKKIPAKFFLDDRIVSKWKGESAQVTGAHVGTG